MDHTFIFEGKDLFVLDEKNNNLLFLIIFDIYNPVGTFWELGLPFLRKEKLYFDIEKENLGVCLAENNHVKNNSIYLNINIALISFLCALIIRLLFLKPTKKQRKKKNQLIGRRFRRSQSIIIYFCLILLKKLFN